MHNRDKTFFLEDILESVDAIFDYIKYIEFEDFRKDRKTFNWCICYSLKKQITNIPIHK